MRLFNRAIFSGELFNVGEPAETQLAGGAVVVRTLLAPIKRRRGAVVRLRPFAEPDEFRVLSARRDPAPTRQQASLARYCAFDEFAILEAWPGAMRATLVPLADGWQQSAQLKVRRGTPPHAMLEQFMREAA